MTIFALRSLKKDFGMGKGDKVRLTQVASYKNAWLRVKAKIKAETLRRKASNVTA
jgi:hypothetical protein